MGPQTRLTSHTREGVIRLEHPKWADFDEWVSIREMSRASLQRWEPDWDDSHSDRKAFKARLGAYRRLATSGSAFPFHVFSPDGRLVGGCNLSDIKRASAQSAQIGYWVGEPYRRRGYALGAVEAALRFAFGPLGLHRVEAAVQDGNIASVRLLEAAKFQPEGIARGYLKIQGQWADHRIWARLAGDAP